MTFQHCTRWHHVTFFYWHRWWIRSRCIQWKSKCGFYLVSWDVLYFCHANKRHIYATPLWSKYFVRLHYKYWCITSAASLKLGERSGSVVECRTPEREVRGSRPTSAVLCPWARHFTPRKYWLITQEAMAPSWHGWKIVDWDVKPQHNQLNL